MGACGSNISEEAASKKKSNTAIESLMASDYNAESSKVKLLLLGAGESGKSTIFKQMKVIYGVPYNDDEKRQILPVIYSNLLSSMKTLVEQAAILNLTDKIVAVNAAEVVKAAPDNAVVDVALGDAIAELWKDPGIQLVWAKRSDFQLIDSVQYYFNKIDLIKQPNYLPDKDDILYARVRTSGIVTERYVIDKSVFEMYDVGGQRNERKKWLHCFEGVTAVIFVAALSEYDQMLFEDDTQNRMTEALVLFKDISNQSAFAESSMILFLNKKDLFAEKVKIKPIKDYFPNYTGPEGDFDAGAHFFIESFMAQKVGGGKVYTHITCATDTKNVEVVFNACKDIILRGNLKDSGFMD